MVQASVVRLGKNVYELIDFAAMTRIQEETRCSPQSIAELEAQARRQGLPTLDELD